MRYGALLVSGTRGVGNLNAVPQGSGEAGPYVGAFDWLSSLTYEQEGSRSLGTKKDHYRIFTIVRLQVVMEVQLVWGEKETVLNECKAGPDVASALFILLFISSFISFFPSANRA